jgi:integrase/recombinase XerD
MEYLDKHELRPLFKAAYKCNRNHHLFLVMSLWHGLRVSEAIRVEGRDFCNGELSVHRLKGSEATIHPVHRDKDPLFDESPILELAANNPGRLFHFSRQRADQFIRKYAKMAGIHPDKAHMHALKHTIAMLIWDETHSLGQIRGYLGHKAPGSTMCYLVEADKRKAYAAVAGISL